LRAENLSFNKDTILNISGITEITEIKKVEIVSYLKSKSEEEFLIFKSFEVIKEEAAASQIKELREKVDFMISRMKRGEKEQKKRSLEIRFQNQKEDILEDIGLKFVGYKKKLQGVERSLEVLNNQLIYIGYPFIKKNDFNNPIFVYPVEIIIKQKGVYIKNIISEDTMVNLEGLEGENSNIGCIDDQSIKKIFQALKSNNKTIEAIVALNIEVEKNIPVEKTIVEKKEITEFEKIIKNINSSLTKRMDILINGGICNYENIYSKNNLYISSRDRDIVKMIAQRVDFLIIGSEKKEKIYEILVSSVLSGDSVLIVTQDTLGIKKILGQENTYLDDDNANMLSKLDINKTISILKEKDNIIKKYNEINKIMNVKGNINLSVKEMCEIVKDYSICDEEEYFKYKKTLNIDNVGYEELIKALYSITLDDIEKYKNYRNLKDRFITFNEYPHSYKELNNIKKSIEEILKVSEIQCNENKGYYKKITFKLKKKGELLNLNELKELGSEIAREKNRELLIEDKNTWSIKNIFNSSKQKEKRREDLELYKVKERQEINSIMELYKLLEKSYRILAQLDKNIFKDIISILCKDTFKEEILGKISSIELSVVNKDTLNTINSWDLLKSALVEYLYKNKNLKGSIEKLILFRISDEISKIAKEYDVDILKEYKNSSSLKIKDMQDERMRIVHVILEKAFRDNTLQIVNQEYISKEIELESEKFDTVILDNCDFKEDVDIIPLAYRGKRCLSFRDTITENKFENKFLFIK
jgi:hypothetical protein